MIVCRIVMVISRLTVLGSLVWFFRGIISRFSYSVKPAIVVIIGHFLICAKFHEFSQKYQNCAEKSKSATRRKLSALVIVLSVYA